MSSAPAGYAMAQPMGSALGMSPIYPGMMGGVRGMPMPNQALMMMGPAQRRRLTADGQSNVQQLEMVADGQSLKKCAVLLENEICAIHDFMTGAMSLEFNVVRSDSSEDVTWNRKVSESGTYMEQQRWIWTGIESGNRCNKQLIAVIGHSVCIKVPVDENGTFKPSAVYAEIVDNIDNRPVARLRFDREDGWSSVYRMESGNRHKMCRYFSGIDVCFEQSTDKDQLVITAITATHSNTL